MHRLELRKYQAETAKDAPVRFVASTSGADRYGDIIDQKGWNLEAYRRNPVVLLNHRADSLPIGRGDVREEQGQLMIDVEFDSEDPQAQQIERKARAGYIHAVSVGFNPIEMISRADLPRDHFAFSAKGGKYFKSAELLEVSIVTIPANSEATLSKSMECAGLRAMIRSVMAEEMRHILEAEDLGDRVVITYAKAEESEPESPEEMPEDLQEESYKEEDSEDEKEQKSNLTNADRDWISAFLSLETK